MSGMKLATHPCFPRRPEPRGAGVLFRGACLDCGKATVNVGPDDNAHCSGETPEEYKDLPTVWVPGCES